MARCHGLSCEFLPPYAPELNPVENLWSYIKRNPLANFAAADIDELFRTTKRAARQIRARPDLLRSFVKGIPLFLRLK
jgi:transposase